MALDEISDETAHVDRRGFPRHLTRSERELVWSLLEAADVPELPVLARQLDAAFASAGCPCGCPTLAIGVAANAKPTTFSGRPVASADSDGSSVSVWIDKGRLSRLDVFWSGGERPEVLPAISSLRNHRRG
jgi:hypothetical protein